MDYADLIERALSDGPADSSLAHILARVDAINKSVPTFDEFHLAVNRLMQRGNTVAQRYSSITREAYDHAVAENWQLILERQGLSRTDVEAVLQRYAKLNRDK